MANLDNRFNTPSSSGGNSARAFTDDPYIGFDLDEQYRILQLIGAGGWGNVYKAEHLETGTHLAVKVIHKHHMQDQLSLKRFELEVKLLMRLESPFVVKILDHGFSPAPYIVMEYFDGEPLHKWLKAKGPMSAQPAIDLFLQLCDGLTAAQSIRIVHRDLKPANIMLKMSDGKVQAKILDFGLAKFIDQSTGGEKLTATGDVLGSPPYMSPEQWKGKCDQRSDIYSLGCIMYEVLSGQPAFSAEYGLDYLNKHLTEKPRPISEVNQAGKIAPALEDVVRKCMQKLPANRYQSAGSCKADLRKLKTGRRPLILLAEDTKVVKTRQILTAAVVAALVIAGGCFLKEPVIRAICAQLYSQADSKLAMGQTDDAVGQYRQVLSLSQLLPDRDMQKLPALRKLAALLKDRKELTAAGSLELQVDHLIGNANTNAELSLILHNIEKKVESGSLSEAKKQCKVALELASSNPGKHSMGYSSCLELLGKIETKQAAYDKAIDAYRQSLALAEEFLEPRSLRKAEIMDSLAVALKNAGKAEESEKYAALSFSLKNNEPTSRIEPVTQNKAVSSGGPKLAQPAQSSSRNPSLQASPTHANTEAKPGSTQGQETVVQKPVEKPSQKEIAEAANQLNRRRHIETHPVSGAVSAGKSHAKEVPAKTQIQPVAAQAARTSTVTGSKPHSSSSGWGEMEKLRGFK